MALDGLLANNPINY